MKITSLLKSKLFAFLVLAFVIISVFWGITDTFYQQDEWNGLGLVFSKGVESIFPGIFSPIDLLLVKGRILSSLIFYFFATLFPLQNMQLAILAIALHATGAFLVFLLAKKLVNNTLLALVGAVFFAVNAVSHGAVTWPVIAISTVGSSILVFASILSFFKFLESTRTNSIRGTRSKPLYKRS
ncbi:MAG: Uncharacterized protein G01um10145_892 [Microgenomates group bacterium Gr01-1014_5]|nr:MAG: Uncharacterized protein G01um10145_892 [Microgenomates group bacterium Gr01-1014_5]